MNNLDYISIGIPIYNAEEHLELAINSVLAQSYPYWELILIDDGSTDNSLKIANRFAEKDKRVRVIHDGENKKLPYRLNQIIDESKFEFIARMDADDVMHPDRLNIQLQFLREHLDIDIVSTGLISINNNNKVYGYRYSEKLFHNITQFQSSYPIAHATILARKSWYLRNKYDNDYPRAEDYELWCRASLKRDLNIATLPNLLYYYREEGNINATKMINAYEDQHNVYLKYHSNPRISEYIKIILKKNIIKILDKTGRLQSIARRRNKTKLEVNVIKNCQKTLDMLLEKPVK